MLTIHIGVRSEGMARRARSKVAFQQMASPIFECLCRSALVLLTRSTNRPLVVR
jgi:hypothetical protein